MPRFVSLLALSTTVAFGLACGAGKNSDKDEDGLTKAEEEALGTDPDSADSDGDGLNDAEEVSLGLDPLSNDTDGDSLLDSDEIEAGLDPLLADTDADGIDDGVEFDAGDKFPNNSYRWPDGLWPDFTSLADDDEGTGYKIGDVMPNFKMMDQFGNPVELYQFYGMVVLLDFSAGWCGPCRGLAEEAQAEYRDRRDDGFVIIHVMIDDNQGNEPDQAFLESWVDDYGLTFPVVAETTGDAYSGLAAAGTYTGSIPFNLLLDRDFTLDTKFSGAPNTSILNRADELLAE
jgi:peroxiredoxin